MCACFECMANMPEPIDDEIIQLLQAKIDEKDKELEALRGFAKEMHEYPADIQDCLRKFNLIDEEHKATKLLTGE